MTLYLVLRLPLQHRKQSVYGKEKLRDLKTGITGKKHLLSLAGVKLSKMLLIQQ